MATAAVAGDGRGGGGQRRRRWGMGAASMGDGRGGGGGWARRQWRRTGTVAATEATGDERGGGGGQRRRRVSRPDACMDKNRIVEEEYPVRGRSSPSIPVNFLRFLEGN